MARLVVEQAGAQTLVEDLGRRGYAHLGVPRSGALDRGAARLATRLVGNPDAHAVLEVLVGGFRARFEGGETWFAVTGAWGRVTLDGRRVAPYTAARARDGSVLELAAAERGIRYLLAVRGGIDEPADLGTPKCAKPERPRSSTSVCAPACSTTSRAISRLPRIALAARVRAARAGRPARPTAPHRCGR